MLVVSGSVRPEGGEAKVNGRKVFSPRRRAANVISTDFARRLRKLRILQTPFGHVVDPVNAAALRVELRRLSSKIVTFHKEQPDDDCHVYNCMVVEPLKDPRRAALQGWLYRKQKEGDPKVLRALDQLLPPEPTAAAAS